ncbi:type II toxin-antitoxin system YafQ family toxin [Rubellimicrobium rubrum]|uniref:Type II toxin-antitoxin system YafQ family toxin n=1 Tax=Rubellimicrobium rubrum TaxID=2585369 RepID=A0A5C4MP14_9RHOB|nr:type II toxin-antitoxin system YafQ family toxin [Rubellimicrobium rubrum]TNC45270.1 type II toxin-antitoxin system YafQ family toxin [Rubellimicrobium rubrum]
MRTIRRTSAFKKDYKREAKSSADLESVLKPVLEALVAGQALPARMVDHPLGGKWKGFRDCHVKPDLVLIYSVTEDELVLAALGSHSELF